MVFTLPPPLPLPADSIPAQVMPAATHSLEDPSLAQFLPANRVVSPLKSDGYDLEAASTSDDGTAAETAEGVESALDPIPSVSQLEDARPGDWAFQALQALVERYGCIVGYPDRTFRGDRVLSRYEFAAGLNACLNRLNELIAAGTADRINREDRLAVQKLQEEFTAELASLRGRTDGLAVRTATLEASQFSTTAILRGQVVFGLVTAAGGNPPGLGETNTVLTNLTQLQLVSSFTGRRDLLRIGLATSNFGGEGYAGFPALNTYMALLSYQGDFENRLAVNAIDYRFAIGDRLVLTLQPVGFSLSSVLSPNSPYSDAGLGAISRFAAYNPLLRIGNLDAGVGLDWLMGDRWRLQVGYGARSGNDPTERNGLFNSGHQAIGVQVLHKPNANTILGFSYINAFSEDGRLDTFTGSSNADLSGDFNQPAKIHAFALSMQWRLSPKITLGAWGGAVLTDSTFGQVLRAITDRDLDLADLGAVTLSSTYLVSLGIHEPFGRKGDQLVFMVGQPPKLNAGVLIERIDRGTSLHFEAFYRFRLNDHLAISPGFFYVTDPGHISENNNIFVGTIRSTFSF